MEKTVIVTGAAGNMGMAVAQKLIRAGHRVIGTRLPHEKLDELAEADHFEDYELDVSDQAATQQFVEEVAGKYGQIDFAALLVGGFAMQTFADTSLDEVRRMMQLNFETAFISSQAVYKKMKEVGKGGHIMMVGAKPALEKGASAGLTPYFLSKKLIFALAENINTEGKEFGIRASVIAPSVLDSPPNRQAMPDADFSQWVTPGQIADVVSFLASNQAAALRDTIIRVYADS
jgi:NAD(P)-dependent dehydrogenase (short-subunit alcohol dehydrogenase family)